MITENASASRVSIRAKQANAVCFRQCGQRHFLCGGAHQQPASCWCRRGPAFHFSYPDAGSYRSRRCRFCQLRRYRPACGTPVLKASADAMRVEAQRAGPRQQTRCRIANCLDKNRRPRYKYSYSQNQFPARRFAWRELGLFETLRHNLDASSETGRIFFLFESDATH